MAGGAVLELVVGVGMRRLGLVDEDRLHPG